jgi:hypothetical protein
MVCHVKPDEIPSVCCSLFPAYLCVYTLLVKNISFVYAVPHKMIINDNKKNKFYNLFYFIINFCYEIKQITIFK